MKSILVVDDDPTALRILRHVLQTADYQIHLADDALEALHVLETGVRPDLIISDVMMPGMLGTDFVAHLAGLPDLARVPVILMTAYHDLARGVKTAAVVLKPFNPMALVELMTELLAEAEPEINSQREPRLLRM